MHSNTSDIEDFYRLQSNFFSIDIEEKAFKIKLDGNQKIEIEQSLIAEKNGFLAWVQHDFTDNSYKIVVYNKLSKNSNSFPLFGEPDETGYDFFSFTWIDSSLFCIYLADHDYFYLHTIVDNDSRNIFIKGDAVRVFDKFATFQKYGRGERPVYKVLVPELIVTDQFSEEKAKSLNIMPQSLGLMYNSDHNFYDLR